MKTTLKAAVAATLATMAAIPTAALAQAASPVLVIDMDRIGTSSLAGRSGQTQLQAKLNAVQARVKTLSDQFRAEEAALLKVRQTNAMAPAAFDAKVKDLQARQSTAQNEINGRRTDLQRSQDTVKKQIYDAVLPIVQSLRAARGAQIVLSRDAAMDFAPATDITAEVIARLDKALPSVNANPPAGK